MLSIYIVPHILVQRFFGHMRPQSELILLIVVNVAIDESKSATISSGLRQLYTVKIDRNLRTQC